MDSKGERVGSSKGPPGEDGNSGFEMMQHLINEMDKSSQRIDEFNTEEFGATAKRPHNDRHHIDLLYDEAWKSEDSDAASLKEVPDDFFDKIGGESGCEDAVTSAIAEVSKDFLAGLRACPTRNQNGDSDDSHLSSDTDFKLIIGKPAYARYPETAAGLSDNDWNPYGTESDTNVSPRLSSQETPGNRASSSKLSALTSFNPPLHSTDLEAVTPSFAIGSIPNTCTRKLGIHDISELEKVVPLKPDVTADFSSISHVSEQTFSSQKPLSEPAKLSDLNKTMRGNELEVYGTGGKGMDMPSHQAPKSSLEYKSFEDPYISVMDRAKMAGIPEDIVDGKLNVHNDSQDSKVCNEIKTCIRPSQRWEVGDTSDDDPLGQKVKKVLQDTRYLDRDQGRKKTMNDVAIDYSSLQRDLQEIQESLNHNFGSSTTSTVVANNADKNDLYVASKNTPPSSDNDADIIPSTTTTPERKGNRMTWDLAGDLASGQIGNHMEEVSPGPYRNSSGSQRPSTEKQSYNSDGDETRTSGSSDKVDDHAAADQALAEMSAILGPHRQLMMTAADSHTTRGISTAQDVDDMLSNFRDQRRELETRYQQLSNPGLADKVFRILTTQDPEAQADGILSQVSAQEREDRARYALGLHNNKDFNFSTTDTDNLNTSNQSFSLPDDVRRRLDLSGLSSADGSKLADKSSFVLPSSKGFSAFDDMTKFLSSQMAKVSEKTFNHSLEMHIPPQVTTCYPLLADYKGKEKEKDKELTLAGVSSAIGHQSEDLFSGLPDEGEPTATSSPIEAFTDEHKDEGTNHHSSPEDSDSSSGKQKEKYRPYRPPGTKDFYYTESDAASIADSVTTIESTHIGSDDAKGPSLPTSALGSRKDPPPSGGIYAKHKALGSVPEGASLPPIHEKSVSDDRDSETNLSSKGSGSLNGKGASGMEASSKLKGSTLENMESSVPKISSSDVDDGIRVRASHAVPSSSIGSFPTRGVAAARRDAQWEHRMRERGLDSVAHQPITDIDETVAKFTELSDLGSISNTGAYSQIPRENGRETQQQPRNGSSNQDLPRDFALDEPLSLRVKMTYTDHPDDKQFGESEEKAERTTRSGADRYEFRKEVGSKDYYREREGLSSRRNDLTRPSASSYFDREEDHPMTSKESVQRRRSWDQDSMSSPARDARLSPAFHRALSAELLQAIEARSPLLSQNIERSLAQAPLKTSTSQWRDPKRDEGFPRRSASPPPTFLARERGQPPREYARSPSREYARSPPREHARSPPREYARSPPREYARSPPREHALSPPREYTRSPPREYAPSPVSMSRRSPPPYLASERQAWTEHRARSPVQQARDRNVSPPPVQNSRSRSPPTLTDSVQAPYVSSGSLSRDQRARTESPSYKVLSRAQGYRSPSPSAEHRTQQTQATSFPNSSQRTPTKNVSGQQSVLNQKQPSSPQRHVERTLENMTSESENTDFDREPLSRRAQMLTAALPQERDISPDINSLWDRFKALNESNESSMDSSRIEAITDLLRNPSRHLIAQYLKEREEYRIERQERAEEDRMRRLRDQQAHHDMAMPQPQLHSSSEDDFNGGYSEMRAKKEEERMKRRAAKKKKGRPTDSGKTRHDLEGETNKENIPDSLFSIPEDAASDHSPMKGSTSQKSLKNKAQPKQHQEDHIIDPNMEKLRYKISKQRGKIDKQTLKEFQRMERLKKLEHLLSAKKRGQISDQTLDAQLAEMSSTSTPGSNSSGENENVNSNSRSTPLSEDSTTAKDSSAEMHAWKAEKERRLRETKLIEMERRKEFKSRQNMETREIDRNMNRKVTTHRSKVNAQNSELKLLKLVNKGYLTAEEAYRLAMDRVQQFDDGEESSICSYCSSEDLNVSNRPHRLYSPYARQDEFSDIKSKHVPKLKQLSPTTFADAGSTFPLRPQSRYQRKMDRREDYLKGNQGARTLPEPSRSTSNKLLPSQASKNHFRTSSRSPSSRTGKPASSFKSHSMVRQNDVGHNFFSRQSGLSPQRKFLQHSHHHQRLNYGSERYPTRQEPSHRRQDAERPTSAKMKGVSWHIPMDTHPSKWEEPQPAGAQTDSGNSREASSKYNGKKRAQLPLPDLPPSSSIEETEEPLQHWERQAHASDDGFWQKSDHPVGIPQEVWQEVVTQDALASKANHYDVDPLMDRVQYILNKESPVEEEPGFGMTLQEAFLSRKQIFISKCRERQKRIALGKENRHLQECLRLEREAIFADQDRPLAPNLHAHPCSENLYQPKQRVFTKTEMKALTQKRYKKLHEVVQKQEKQKTEAEQKLNRLRVRMFNKKVQRGVLKKPSMRRR